MYDELFCDTELSDIDLPSRICIQTKSFPGRFLFQYRIFVGAIADKACAR
jgi:hypothetical protein